MSGLPERLRSRLAEAARVLEAEVGRGSDGRCKLCGGRRGEGHYADDSQPCAFAVVERVLSDLAELAAQQPEALAAGELPAAVERAMILADADAHSRGERLTAYGALAAIKPLWPAPPPPAAWEAIEKAVREACSADADLWAHLSRKAGSDGLSVNLAVNLAVVFVRDRAAAALRSVELASAARAARLEAALRALWTWCQDLYSDPEESIGEGHILAAVKRTLDAAPPSDPLAALMEVLSEVDARAVFSASRHTSQELDLVARRLRAALGLLAAEAPDAE